MQQFIELDSLLVGKVFRTFQEQPSGAFQDRFIPVRFELLDLETTTQSDRNLGIVNIWVGFAPLKPAEFVIIYLQQIAGKLEV